MAIYAHEVQECQTALDARLSDQTDFPTSLEHCAGNVLIDAVSHRRQHSSSLRLLQHTGRVDEVSLVWAAGHLAKHFLQVDCAEWHIMTEHSVNDLVVVLQDCNLVFHATDRFAGVEMWTRLHEIVVCHRISEHSGLKVDSHWRVDFARVRALLRRLFRRPLVCRDIDALSNACLDH